MPGPASLLLLFEPASMPFELWLPLLLPLLEPLLLPLLEPPLLLPLLPLPLLLPLLEPLLLPLPPPLDEDDVGSAAHSPFWQMSEQQSPNFEHAPPVALHVAAVPPQVPPWQSALQQSLDVEHVLPSAEQLGGTQEPPVHVPLQHWLVALHTSPEPTHDPPPLDAPPLDPPPQTPEQDRLQQSSHELQMSPEALQAPPPSAPSQELVAAFPAQPQTMMVATMALFLAVFMAGSIATPVPSVLTASP